MNNSHRMTWIAFAILVMLAKKCATRQMEQGNTFFLLHDSLIPQGRLVKYCKSASAVRFYYQGWGSGCFFVCILYIVQLLYHLHKV